MGKTTKVDPGWPQTRATVKANKRVKKQETRRSRASAKKAIR